MFARFTYQVTVAVGSPAAMPQLRMASLGETTTQSCKPLITSGAVPSITQNITNKIHIYYCITRENLRKQLANLKHNDMDVIIFPLYVLIKPTATRQKSNQLHKT